MKNVNSLIKDRTVNIYDGSLSVAKTLRSFESRKITAFTREQDSSVQIEGLHLYKHLSALAASENTADVCLLDGSALKVLVVRYPADARCVLARIAFRSGWLIGVPGLLRRVVLGRVRLGGVRVLVDERGHKSYWLVLDRTSKTRNKERLFVPRDEGVQAFLDWLRAENINYVVPRFYESLPRLHREDGDLDLLVSNEDKPKVVEYVRSKMRDFSGSNADMALIGLHTVSNSRGVAYYPSPLARKILATAIDGPAGSRIPAPKEALLSFMYHCLYHRTGYSTGIPTTLNGHPEHSPGNDYGAEIRRLAGVVGVEIGETMEEMDEYLAAQGWRPKRDTLARLTGTNAWVHDRFFKEQGARTTGVTVYILKERALERGLVGGIERTLENNGLKIIRTTTLTEEQKRRAANDIRGGNWVDKKRKSEGLLPAAILIAVDAQCANLPMAYASEYERICAKQHKKQLREAIDEIGAPSLVHAADNTREAWEYIEASIPEEAAAIREEVERIAPAPYHIRLQRLASPTYGIPYAKHYLHSKARDFIARRLS